MFIYQPLNVMIKYGFDIPYLTHIVLVICSHGIAMGILYNICAYFSNKLDYKTFFKNS